MNTSFPRLLAQAARDHGHMCPGQVIGVRLGMLGLALFGLDAPLGHSDIKKVIVYVEIDRCAADALVTATGVRLGRRSLKFVDQGMMAATFVRLTDRKAYRVSIRDEARELAARLLPDVLDSHLREIRAYQVMEAKDLFRVEEVRVHLNPEDLPGASPAKAWCGRCGETIRHGRAVERDGELLCRNCAGLGYFDRLGPVRDWTHLDPIHQDRPQEGALDRSEREREESLHVRNHS
jgi:formylmethanofuran dehydrogenase subunit E